MELLIVMLIIGIMAMSAVPLYFKTQWRSEVTAAANSLLFCVESVYRYYALNQKWPYEEKTGYMPMPFDIMDIAVNPPPNWTFIYRIVDEHSPPEAYCAISTVRNGKNMGISITLKKNSAYAYKLDLWGVVQPLYPSFDALLQKALDSPPS